MGKQVNQVRAIRLLLFNDKELKELMAIPKKDLNNLIIFRDNYCIAGFGTTEMLNNPLPCRILFYWGTMGDTKNHKVGYRQLFFEIWVQKSKEYGVTNNVLDRRQELIAERIRKIISNNKIEDYSFYFDDMGDLHSNTQDYVRYFLRFRVKYIKF